MEYLISLPLIILNSVVADIPDEPYILTIRRPHEGPSIAVIIIASVSAFAVIVGLALLFRKKRGEKQTPQAVEE